ncbi:MAG: organic hydroperoxide resistance protein [Methyloligellaceae bacterium]
MKILYSTKSWATGGRTGQAASEDGKLEVTLSTPKELGGDGGEGTNPEQLFAAGYAGCFLGAMKVVAGKTGVALPEDTKVVATVGLGMGEDKALGLDVELAVTIPGFEQADARKLVEAAHNVCPYSNATRNNIDVRLSVA